MAQFGRALRSGRRGRKFKSCHLDHISFKPHFYAVCFFTLHDFYTFYSKNPPTEPYQTPAWERASSPLREFSFRVPLLFLAFFDFGYKNTALFKSGKIIKFGSDLHRTSQKRLFLQSLCLKSAIIANKHCKLTFGLIKPFVISLVRTMQVKIKCNQLHTGIRKPLTAVGG